MKRLLICIIGLSLLTACSDATAAKRALEDAGYTEVRTTGHSFWGCGQGDTYKTGFNAVGPTGRAVKGVVCSGWMKGATIRLF